MYVHCVIGSGWLQDKFLEQFCEDAYECCAKDRKKSLAYKHLGNLSLSPPLFNGNAWPTTFHIWLLFYSSIVINLMCLNNYIVM